MQDLVVDGNRRVLVIDDNAAIHEDFKKIFAYDDSDAALRDMEALCFGEEVDTTPQLKIEIDSAMQGEEGRDKVAAAVAKGSPYALAFVDMRMPPGWDGLRTIEELWKVDPELQIVICSAYSDNTWEDIYKRLGKTDQLLILKKPFDNTEVSQLALALTEKWNLAWQASLKQEELEQIVEQRTYEIQRKDEALRQKQKLESIGSLAAGVAHQFNNSLQIVLGYVQFAMDDMDEKSQSFKDLFEAKAAAQKSADVVEQLLTFGSQKSSMKMLCKLHEVVASVEKVIEASLGNTISFQTELDENCGQIYGDASAIVEALLNLCLNAREAMPQGGDLTVKTYQSAIGSEVSGKSSAEMPRIESGDYAVIEVADGGYGIPPSLIERVFDPFFTTKDVNEGSSGMGLSMVYGTMVDHKGTVTVESEEGKGSTFRAFFPVLEQSEATQQTNAGEEGDAADLGEDLLLA